MRILILDWYYDRALESLYQARPGLERATYDEQLAAVLARSIGTADFYSRGLTALGHQAAEAVINSVPLQEAWAREHGSSGPGSSSKERWLRRVALQRIERERPDVLYVQGVFWPDRAFLLEARRHVRLIAGQTAYPLPASLDLSLFDVMFSSFPHYVQQLRRDGVPAEELRIGFDPIVLERAGAVPRARDAVFVGSFGGHHSAASRLLAEASQLAPLEVWGPGELPPGSPLQAVHRGEAWGLDMYRVIASAKIVVNRHIDVAGPYANNMRLFEATGVGALLVTEEKTNLADLFEPGREVVTYRAGDAHDLATKINHYLTHDEERETIARAGQARTLREHTYAVRMRELVGLLEEHLARPRRRVSALSLPAARARAAYGALRTSLAASPLAPALRPLVRAWRRLAPVVEEGVSRRHRLLTDSDRLEELGDGWKEPAIARRQRALVESELRAMYFGSPPEVFRVAAEAVRLAGLRDGLLVEVGCASGYYLDVLTHLLGRRLRYAGLDYSPHLLAQARSLHPEVPFALADATRLPLADRSVDVLLSGGVILHVADWKHAVAESARVSRDGCIFHRTPVVERAESAVMTKLAYDVEVFELAFSRAELERCFAENGLAIEARLVVGRSTIPEVGACENVTYVCRVRGAGP